MSEFNVLRSRRRRQSNALSLTHGGNVNGINAMMVGDPLIAHQSLVAAPAPIRSARRRLGPPFGGPPHPPARPAGCFSPRPGLTLAGSLAESTRETEGML